MDVKKLQAIAKHHQVKRLELFGSTARGSVVPNDYDFFVEFEPMPPLEHGRMYFALLESLEANLNAKVDLIELEAVTNPYFLQAVSTEQMVVYAVGS
ncbi:MAG: nucleotidyltransferase family protein [Trueperaceae bacterium]